MAAKSIDDAFQLIGILSSAKTADNGSVLLQTGDAATGFVENDSVEHWQQPGLQSLPPNPVPGQSGTQAVVFRQTDTDICIATREIRGQQNSGNLGPGETMLYAAGADGTSQGRILLKNDSSVNIYTSASAGATGMAIMVTPSSDTISLVNAAGFGIIISPDGITLTAGDSALTLGASGAISLVGKGQTQIDGTSVVLGSIAVPGLNSVLTGVTGIAGVASTKIFAQTA